MHRFSFQAMWLYPTAMPACCVGIFSRDFGAAVGRRLKGRESELQIPLPAFYFGG